MMDREIRGCVRFGLDLRGIFNGYCVNGREEERAMERKLERRLWILLERFLKKGGFFCAGLAGRTGRQAGR